MSQGAGATVAWRNRISLAGFLAAVLALELVANRIGWRLASDALLPRGTLELVDVMGLFSFHLASAASVLLVGLAMMRLLLDPTLRPSAGRVAASRVPAMIATVGFIVVAAIGLFRQLPAHLEVYLVVLFTLLCVHLVVAAWSLTAGRGRLRLWLVLLVAAFATHLAWLVPAQLQIEGATPYPRLLLSLGEALAVTCAATAPMGLLSSAKKLLLPAVFGAVVACGALGLALFDRPLAALLAAYGAGLELPGPTVGIVLYAVALGALCTTLVALFSRPGPSRLAGTGLSIIVLSGYQLELPYQVAATLFGMLCVVEAAVRERLAHVAGDSWDALVRRVAARVGAREVLSAGPAGFEELLLRISTDGETTELAVRRVAFQLDQAELAIGQAPSHEAPPLSLHGRAAPRMGKKDGPEVQTGDAAFDALFAIFDARRLDRADPLLADDMRPRLHGLDSAWLGVWPGAGVRLRTISPRILGALEKDGLAHEAELRELIALLIELKRR